MAMRLIEKVVQSRTVLFVETSSKIIIINKYKYEWKTSCNTATDYNETSFMQEVYTINIGSLWFYNILSNCQ